MNSTALEPRSRSHTASQLYSPYGSVRYSSGTLPTSCGYTVQRAGANFALAVMFTQPAAAGAGEAVNAAVSVGVNASPKICIATCASPSLVTRHMYRTKKNPVGVGDIAR